MSIKQWLKRLFSENIEYNVTASILNTGFSYYTENCQILKSIMKRLKQIKRGTYEIVVDKNIVYINKNLTNIAEFKLSEFPGCCGLAILYNVDVHSAYQRKGIGTEMVRLAIDFAAKTGYTKLLLTTKENNIAMQHIIKTFGFEKIDTFKNLRTDNDIATYSLDLTKIPKQ